VEFRSGVRVSLHHSVAAMPYQKQHSSLESKDVTIRTFSELSSSLRDEYQAYLRVLEESSDAEESLEDAATETEPDDEDIPF
jgi:hypothetical protein